VRSVWQQRRQHWKALRIARAVLNGRFRSLEAQMQRPAHVSAGATKTHRASVSRVRADGRNPWIGTKRPCAQTLRPIRTGLVSLLPCAGRGGFELDVQSFPRISQVLDYEVHCLHLRSIVGPALLERFTVTENLLEEIRLARK